MKDSSAPETSQDKKDEAREDELLKPVDGMVDAQAASPRKESGGGCFSFEAAPDKTRICLTQSLFISTSLLLKLKNKYGPGQSLAPRLTKAFWKRYAWQMVRHIIGKDQLTERIAHEKQQGIGIGKLLKRIAPSKTDILTAVMRKCFTEWFLPGSCQLAVTVDICSVRNPY